MIREYIEEHLRLSREEKSAEWEEKHRERIAKGYEDTVQLWASDLMACPRKPILRLMEVEAAPFPIIAVESMETGKHLEQMAEDALAREFGDRLHREVRFISEDRRWYGKADYVIDEGEETATIVEHKATGDKWFDYKEQLPKPEHVAQLSFYGYMHYQKHGVMPRLILYYRAWRNWAEFEVWMVNDGLFEVGAGKVNGTDVNRSVSVNLLAEMEALDGPLFEFEKSGEISPFPLYRDGPGLCTFNGRPSCQYYDWCYGE